MFTVFTKGGKFHRMVHGGFKALLQEYERLRKKEDKARKEAAIKAKMDAAYAKVGRREASTCGARETEEIEQAEGVYPSTTPGRIEGKGLYGGRSTAPLALPMAVVPY